MGGESTEVLVAGARFDEEREHAGVFHGDFGSDDGPDALFLSGVIGPRCSVNAVSVQDAQSRELKIGCRFDELFRGRSAAMETEGAPSVEFNVV